MRFRNAILCLGAALLAASAADAQVPRSSHVVLVAEENHSYSSVTSSSVPYLYSLATKYGMATNFYAVTHPSIGNYFMLTTGQIITNSDGYSGTVSADNIVRHMLTSGVSWKSYAESLPYAGYTGGDVYPYSKHHNPFVYFADVVNSSQKYNIVPFTQFASDLANGALPAFSFVVPNKLHDAHDGSLGSADSWLRNNIAPLLASPQFQQDGLLVVWFDESYSSDTARGGGHIFVALIGPKVKPGVRVGNLYQHQHLLRTLMEALGMTTFPGAAANASDMAPFFGSSTPPAPSGTPAVTITSPPAGTTAPSPVTVNARFSNGGTPQYMKLWVDGVARFFNSNSTSLAYSLALAPGPHQVIVQAYNGTLYSSTANVTVGGLAPASSQCTLNTVSPSVTICTPANNSTVRAPVAIQAGSTDSSTVYRMQLYVDGVKRYETLANNVTTSLNLPAGTHRFAVQAFDKAGRVFKSVVYATVR